MNKSSILSRAGNQSLSNSTITPVVNQKPTKQPQNTLNYLKSSISDNLLQEMDDDYPQIQNYQTQYLDQSGQYLDQSGKYIQQSKNQQTQTLQPSRAQSQNQFLLQKSKLSQKPLLNQPIIEEPHHAQDDQTESPIKGLNKPSSKQSNSSNIFSQQQSPQRPGTLLKNYSKAMNKYEKELELISEQKKKAKNKINQKPSYLTNSRGLAEEEFYKLDYFNTGQYKLNITNTDHSHQGSPAFFNTRLNDLQGIEDILSDIASLNESSSNTKYTSRKVFTKGGIDSMVSSMSKYKGNKNFLSFGSSKKLNSSLREKPDFTSKLDDLLTNYRLSESMMGSSQFVSSSMRKDMLNSSYNKGILGNQSGISELGRFDEKNRRELRRIKREQNSRRNKQYDQVKNEIKYGMPESEQRQIQDKDSHERRKTKKSQVDADKQVEIKKKSIEVDLSQRTSNKDINRSQKIPDKDTIELANQLRLYHINWKQIPLIPAQCHESLYQFKSYPNFTPDQTQLLVSAFQTISNNQIRTYSIFSNTLTQRHNRIQELKKSNNILVGVKQLPVEGRNKVSVKSYKLLSKKQFIQIWNKVYQDSVKTLSDNSTPLTQQQVQILIEFDLKWYTALVKFIYQKDLSTLIDSYKNKKQSQYESVIDSKKYIQTLELIQNYSPTQNLSLLEAITINKLNLLKHIFSSIKHTLSTQQSFGIIPSILSVDRSQKEEQLIKQFLKNNFRGGIYFTDVQNFQNLCILQLYKNQRIHIEQISNQRQKEVRINQKLILNINSKKNTQQSSQQRFQINITIENNTQQDEENYDEEETLRLDCHFNQIQYEVQQQTLTEQILHFCKKYHIIVNP